MTSPGPGRSDDPRRVRPRRDLWGGLKRLAAVVLGCGILWFGSAQMGPAWRAAHADGVSAMLTVTHVSCGGRDGCSRLGDFRSGDGAVTLRAVDLIGADGDVGDRVYAFYEGDEHQVYARSWRGFTEAVLMVTAGAGLLVGGAVWPLLGTWLLRRSPPTGRHARAVWPAARRSWSTVRDPRTPLPSGGGTAQW